MKWRVILLLRCAQEVRCWSGMLRLRKYIFWRPVELMEPRKAQPQATISGVRAAADASEECACQRDAYAESGLVDWERAGVEGASSQERPQCRVCT